MESSASELGSSRGRSKLRILAVLLALTLLTLAGYLAFTSSVKGLVMATSPLTLLLFAVVAGIATFFNPCSFPLLPGYLTYYASGEKAGQYAGWGRSVSNALVAGIGVAVFALLLGAIIGTLGSAFGRSLALGGGQPNEFVLLFRGIIGTLLIALGLSHFFGRGINFHFLSPLGQRFSAPVTGSQTKGLFTYGFGYNAIGIGCGGPIMAGLAVFAFSTGGFTSAFLAFGVYAATMLVLMVSISLLANSAKGALKSLRRSTARVQRITSIAQVAVGVMLILSVIYVDVFVGILFPS